MWSYHEGLPGHHLQVSIARELGFYVDPYLDFGRLVNEMWRACRLVIDTGIHTKGWSREKAGDCRELDRRPSGGPCPQDHSAENGGAQRGSRVGADAAESPK